MLLKREIRGTVTRVASRRTSGWCDQGLEAISAVRYSSNNGGNGKGQDNDNMFLADALNLLSPRSGGKGNVGYKPSLLNSLTSKESFSDEEIRNFVNYQLPASDTKQHLDNLLAGLNVLSLASSKYEDMDKLVQKMTFSQLKQYVNKTSSQDALLELTGILYSQNKISLKLMTEILLNKNLVDLNRLPFNLHSVGPRGPLIFPGWSEIQVLQLKVVLLKKYYDLHKPLLIIKILKENFESGFLPAIQRGVFTPFYERIVWKFYFEYMLSLGGPESHREEHFIKSLNNLKTSMLIWESSVTHNSQVIQCISAQHNHIMSPLQKIFVSVAANPIVQQIISKQLASSNPQTLKSVLLSRLKHISIKYKLYSIPPIDQNLSMSEKSALYSLINSLEAIVLDVVVTNDSISQPQHLKNLTLALKELRDIKQGKLMNFPTSTTNESYPTLTSEWERFLLLMNK